MSAEDGTHRELEPAIARLYAGPLEGFIGGRDALVKELRAAGRREAATMVKGLRKPARMAWALDAAALGGSATMERLAAGVTGALEAQSGGGDVRGAFGELRAAVRSFADDASRAAAERGHPVDHASLVNAVLAVIAKPDAFGALRAGRLADIPEAGGLDFLTSLPAARAAVPGTVVAEPAAEHPEAVTASREALQRAEDNRSAARERSAAAQRALDDAEASVAIAEQQLLKAEQEAQAKRAERDRARQEAKAAAAELIDAAKAESDARRRVEHD